MSDRRVHRRYEAIFKVKFRDERSFLEEYARNLSKGGMFITTENPKEVGSIIKVLITLPITGEEIESEARVVHVIDRETSNRTGFPMGMGVEFVNVTPQFEEKLHRCVELLEKERVRISDRRRAPRAVMKIGLHIEDPQGSEKLEEHFLMDFSQKGIFVKTPKLWPPDTEVKLLIEVPSTGYVREMKGKVRWAGPKEGQQEASGVGVEFEISEEEIRHVLQEILDHIFAHSKHD